MTSKGLSDLVENYKRHHSYCFLDICLPVEKVETIEDCVRIGKKRHHRRMTEETMLNAITALNESNIFKQKIQDFEELYDFVADAIIGIKGIGRLAIYDITVRIGKNLINPSIMPRNFVYLQRGALEGAKKLLRNHKFASFREPIDTFPKELQKLGSFHIENFLCVNKNDL